MFNWNTTLNAPITSILPVPTFVTRESQKVQEPFRLVPRSFAETKKKPQVKGVFPLVTSLKRCTPLPKSNKHYSVSAVLNIYKPYVLEGTAVLCARVHKAPAIPLAFNVWQIVLRSASEFYLAFKKTTYFARFFRWLNTLQFSPRLVNLFSFGRKASGIYDVSDMKSIIYSTISVSY